MKAVLAIKVEERARVSFIDIKFKAVRNLKWKHGKEGGARGTKRRSITAKQGSNEE